MIEVKKQNGHKNNRRRRSRRELSRESKEREIRNEIKLFGGHVKMGENMKEKWEKDVERICEEVQSTKQKYGKFGLIRVLF